MMDSLYDPDTVLMMSPTTHHVGESFCHHAWHHRESGPSESNHPCHGALLIHTMRAQAKIGTPAAWGTGEIICSSCRSQSAASLEPNRVRFTERGECLHTVTAQSDSGDKAFVVSAAMLRFRDTPTCACPARNAGVFFKSQSI